MASVIKILVLGAGSIGTRHIKNLVTLGYANLAVCDPDLRRKVAIEAIASVRWYRDEATALKQEKPVVVFVCNPTSLHVFSAMRAVRAGADVFIEKPLSYSLAGVDALIHKAEQKKRVVMVGCNWRFHRGWQELSRVIRAKKFGTPILARIAVGYYLPTARTTGAPYRKIYAAKKRGGGVILDSGSHMVDYLQPLLGPIERGIAMENRTDVLKIESEEAAHLVFFHRDGITSAVSLDYVSKKPIHRIEIVTVRGLLTLDMRRDTLTFQDGEKNDTLYQGSGDLNEMFLDELRHFFECVQKRKKPLQDLKGAHGVLEVLLRTRRFLRKMDS